MRIIAFITDANADTTVSGNLRVELAGDDAIKEYPLARCGRRL